MNHSRFITTLAVPALLGACTTGPEGDPALRDLSVEQISETRFSVSVEAVNVDGYELARCIGAAYTAAQVDDDGEPLYPFYVRDGGKIVDEFRRKDGVREQTSRGVQTYAFATADDYTIDDHDGRDVMAVELQRDQCEKQGLPSTLGDS